MATEAQRLITVSLGKIHTARAQRGGVNLHKSLLVTTVLFKAKAVFMVEHMNGNKASHEQSTIKITREEYEREVARENETTDSCVDNNDQVVPDIECPESGYDDEEENGDMDTVLNKENTPPKHRSTCSADETKSDNNKETHCARRNKRKLTEVEAAVESISPKKSKCDSEQSSKKSDTCEPMQTETVQITNLVRSFNSGFGGLLSSNTQNVQQEQSKIQGHVSSASESIISCSTQIKESFDILSRPAIALSV